MLRRLFVLGMIVLMALAGQACHQAPVDGVLRIGMPEEPRTLNVWLASDANSRNVLRQIYQPLYVRDPKTLAFVPWLAADLPVWDPDRLTYTVRLRPARWSDGRALTSADVAFTGRLITAFNIPGLAPRWSYIDRIETPDPRTVVFHVIRPYATFLSRTLDIVIVPAHQWRPIANAARKNPKPLMALLNQKIENPIGAGPFMLVQWRRGAFLYFKRNPYFFGRDRVIDGRTLGPWIKGLLFKIYGTTDVAMLALQNGGIDMYWQHIQPGYLGILHKHPNIRIYSSEKSAIYFMGFNLRRPPFDDVVLRRAVSVLINKDFIVKRLLQDQGTKMWSIIPPGNHKWYDPDVPRYGEGMSRSERIRTAYAMLKKAGYTWRTPPVDAKGNVVPGQGIRLPDGRPMAPFTILTPPADYDPARAISGTFIQQWLRQLGLPASARPMEFDALVQHVKGHHDFDAFILGYGRLPLDPDYLGTFFTSANDRPRGWNVTGYRNQGFDRLARRSECEMNPDLRRRIVDTMQRQIMTAAPCVPLYLPYMIEAVRTDRFTGWVPMLDGIGNPWSFALLRETKH